MLITLKIDERYKDAKRFVKFLRKLPFVKIKEIKSNSKNDEFQTEVMNENEKNEFLMQLETEKNIKELWEDFKNSNYDR